MISNLFLAKWLRWFFWLLVIILIAIFIAGAFFFYQYWSSQGLTVQITGPSEANIGVPFELTVSFDNQSKNILKNARLNFSLPENAVFLGMSQNQRVSTKELGDLNLGNLSQESYRLLITNDENTLKRFTASIIYESSDIGRAQFEVRANFDIQVKESGVSLNLSLPDQVLSNEKFSFKINYRNLTQEKFSNLQLRLNYPSNFTFDSANPKPDEANNLWLIPDLAADAGGEIIINGRLVGPSRSFYYLTANLSADFLNQHYTLSQKSGSLTIAPSPLESEITLNEQENYIARLGDKLIYAINYQNNSGVGLNDVVIKAKLTGAMFDFTTLQSDANFNSIANTLTWNVSNTPGLKLIAAGENGIVTFQIKVKNQFLIKRLSDKNYYLKVETQMESPTVPYYLAANKTTSLAALETKVAGALKIEDKVYFYKGPWPPKVNQPTKYAVHWLITNYATNVKNIEVRAFLESGVNWVGQAKSNIASSTPIYNDRTQEIVWFIDKIPATKGVISAPLEAVFQIEATPNITQIGNYQPLIKESSLTAFDEFSEINLQNQAPAVTTALPDDFNVSQIKGLIIQ
jgi:hypothetical protein